MAKPERCDQCGRKAEVRIYFDANGPAWLCDPCAKAEGK